MVNNTETINSIQIDSPLGAIIATANNSGILSVLFNNADSENKPDEETKSYPANINISENNYLKMLYHQLNEYFDGKRKSFELTLNPAGTPFQQKVWTELQNISFGETRTYQQQTNKMGDPKAIRAVASANGKNPIAIIIPCHRIVGSDGSLTGYAGGLWRKKWLLEHEAKYSGKSYQSNLGL